MLLIVLVCEFLSGSQENYTADNYSLDNYTVDKTGDSLTAITMDSEEDLDSY